MTEDQSAALLTSVRQLVTAYLTSNSRGANHRTADDMGPEECINYLDSKTAQLRSAEKQRGIAARQGPKEPGIKRTASHASLPSTTSAGSAIRRSGIPTRYNSFSKTKGIKK